MISNFRLSVQQKKQQNDNQPFKLYNKELKSKKKQAQLSLDRSITKTSKSSLETEENPYADIRKT